MRQIQGHRRLLSACLALVLLCAQLLAAAYACPQLDRAGTDAAAAMADCTGHDPALMDPELPQLCKAHCDPGGQSTPTPQATGVPALPVLLWAFPGPSPQAGLRRPPQAPPDDPARGTPPLYLSLLVLRN